MSSLDIRVMMLEKLFDFTVKGKIKNVYIFSEYVFANVDDVLQSKEKIAYTTAVNDILLAANSFEVDDLNYAEESVNAYKKITNWL